MTRSFRSILTIIRYRILSYSHVVNLFDVILRDSFLDSDLIHLDGFLHDLQDGSAVVSCIVYGLYNFTLNFTICRCI